MNTGNDNNFMSPPNILHQHSFLMVYHREMQDPKDSSVLAKAILASLASHQQML